MKESIKSGNNSLQMLPRRAAHRIFVWSKAKHRTLTTSKENPYPKKPVPDPISLKSETDALEILYPPKRSALVYHPMSKARFTLTRETTDSLLPRQLTHRTRQPAGFLCLSPPPELIADAERKRLVVLRASGAVRLNRQPGINGPLVTESEGQAPPPVFRIQQETPV